TGSHIPPDRIGLIFLESDGAYCSDVNARQIEAEYERIKNHYTSLEVKGLQDLSYTGKVTEAPEVWDVYSRTLGQHVDLARLRQINLRVCVDPGNGTASSFFTSFLRSLGLDVLGLHDSIQPVSERLSEPIDTNLSRLKRLVTNATELGVAFDLDADRVNFVIPGAPMGTVVPAVQVGAVLLNSILQKGYRGDVILPVNTSMLLEAILKRYSITPIYCRIGQPGTIEAVKKLKHPLFALEESGKFYFLNRGLLWTDGILTALKVVELISEEGKPFTQILHTSLGDLMEYTTLNTSIQVADHYRGVIGKKFADFVQSRTLKGEANRFDLDGIRINFQNKSWLLLRPSGTEPKIRIVADARNAADANELLQQGKNLVLEFLKLNNLGGKNSETK
ncbi:MAG TPA: hypothetical protein VJ044_03625, partial [Candidatus Hodarchaeales archaeon]|nr:hypothetical protein [Candidatus Hodarchaeales archaeon]